MFLFFKIEMVSYHAIVCILNKSCPRAKRRTRIAKNLTNAAAYNQIKNTVILK